MRKLADEISIEKLSVVSIFVFLIFFPYSLYGYLAFFPDISCVLLGYWLASNGSRIYGIIIIGGVIAILRYVFGGDVIVSISFVVVSFIVSLLSSYLGGIPANIYSVLVITLLGLIPSVVFRGLISDIFISFELQKFLKFSIYVFLKIGSTLIFVLVIYPIVYQPKLKFPIFIR